MTKRRARAATALALLAIVATCFHMAATGPPDAAGHDADVLGRGHGRRLGSRWSGGLPSAVAEGRSCVLITSQGGVASTAFLAAVEEARARGPASTLCVNDRLDFDHLKHLYAGAWDHNSTGVWRDAVLPPKVLPNGTTAANVEVATFHKVLVIVGDPVHTIESTHRRFGTRHFRKLVRYQGVRPYRNVPIELSEIYRDIATGGRDRTGVAAFVTSWHEASLGEDWPEVRLATAPMLLDNAVWYARWMGFGGHDLEPFRGISFDPSRRSSHGTGAPREVAEVFGPVYEILDQLETGEPAEE